MSLYRVVLVGLAAAFTVGMTSLASAGCFGCAPAPIQYAPSYCGGCGAPSAAIVYAQPVMPAPPPVTYGFAGGCGCGQQSIVYAAPPIAPTPIAPAPIYVVNQGPDYEGPGITVPYHTWSRVSAYGPVREYDDEEDYGYRPRYGMGYYGHRHHMGYGGGYGYRFGGYGYRSHPSPWRFRARLAFRERFHERFIGFPHHRMPMPMMRHHWYR